MTDVLTITVKITERLTSLNELTDKKSNNKNFDFVIIDC